MDTMKKNTDYVITYGNLAVPEIHTGRAGKKKETMHRNVNREITYDTLAIPEIHILKKKAD